MTKEILGDFSTLNENHELFLYLEKKPTWWVQILSDTELYIEVRKDNYINVYYQDGCIFLIQMHKGKLKVTSHKKYLSGVEIKGKTPKSSPYWEVTDNLLNDVCFLKKIKNNISTFYQNNDSKKSKEEYSEKYIQWQIAVDNRERIIDSEFAYNLDQEIPDLRIDLVSVDYKGEIKFIELKRIGDNRMLNKDMSEPEVVDQVRKYTKFIAKYKTDILNYYIKIYQIKAKLGIFNKNYANDRKVVFISKPKSINPTPKLIIADLYTKVEAKRRKRIENIKECIKDVEYEFFPIMTRSFNSQVRNAQIRLYKQGFFGKANNNGLFSGRTYPFVLKTSSSFDNLWQPIQDDVNTYFKEYSIKWWGENEKSGLPSGHLVSSQIQCLNHLFAIRKEHDSVLAIINNAVKANHIQFDKVLPMQIDNKEAEPNYIAFEFVRPNYLGENDKGACRGSMCTSIDAAVIAIKGDKKYLIPIEWKFTETYSYVDKTNSTRLDRYEERIKHSNQLIAPLYGVPQSLYLREPYYELMRQTLLAEQMIENNEVNDFIHINIIPSSHTELREAITRYYIPMLKQPDKFKIMDPAELLCPLKNSNTELISYLQTRYWN